MTKPRMPIVRLAVFVLILFFFGAPANSSRENAVGRTMAHQAVKSGGAWTTVDHSRLKPLDKVFTSGDEVTAACVSCHTEAETQFKKTIHWTWIDPASDKEILTGKGGHSINNFCLNTNKMNDKGCLVCHTGWNGKEGRVNCLKCHNQSGFDFGKGFADYNAFMEKARAGDPKAGEKAAELMDQIKIALVDIGPPERKNCGACHFNGGGGDGVKHGDLDTSLTHPGRNLDVHMGHDGQNFACVRCHTTVKHLVAGRIYSTPAASSRKSLVEDDLAPKITCESCHTAFPHKQEAKPNDHTDKVACQSCHIPFMARVNPTKIWWDWSAAGRLKDGKPYSVEGEFGKHTYLSIKGDMKWAKNVVPQYHWFNGSIYTLTVKDVIDPTGVVNVSWPVGLPDDETSRIFPFKVHQGKGPYDKESNRLLGPLLTGEHGFWTTLDWPDALRRGADFLEVPFSGNFDFVRTQYVFPTTHMVAPKEQVLKCGQCHVPSGGRLAGLTGFYMPGRDRYPLVDMAGWLLVASTLVGVLIHGLGRYLSRFRKEG